jgi:hypothetical protein
LPAPASRCALAPESSLVGTSKRLQRERRAGFSPGIATVFTEDFESRRVFPARGASRVMATISTITHPLERPAGIPAHGRWTR